MLPKVNAPIYDVKLLSLREPVKYRPYLVKEEKLLLMAQQSEDPKEVESAVAQIIRNCTFDKVNALTLPSFDMELLFLQLRARSVNNIIEVNFRCEREHEGAKCGQSVKLDIAIDDIKLTIPEGHTNTLWLTDDLGVTMKYPTAALFDLYQQSTDPHLVEVLSKTLDTIFTKTGEVHEVKDANPGEVTEFIESLNLHQVETIRGFFQSMPRLEHSVNFKCPKCKYEETIVLRGLQDFFD